MFRATWINLLLGLGGVALLAWLFGDGRPADETARDVVTGIARGRPAIDDAVDAVVAIITVVQLVLITAIAGVVYLWLVRSGRLHAPWVNAHVVVRIEAWRRRHEAAAEARAVQAPTRGAGDDGRGSDGVATSAVEGGAGAVDVRRARRETSS